MVGKKPVVSAYPLIKYLGLKLLLVKNPICHDILRFRAKTKPQIKRKRQGMPNWHPLKANSVKNNVPKSEFFSLHVWFPWKLREESPLMINQWKYLLFIVYNLSGFLIKLLWDLQVLDWLIVIVIKTSLDFNYVKPCLDLTQL